MPKEECCPEDLKKLIRRAKVIKEKAVNEGYGGDPGSEIAELAQIQIELLDMLCCMMPAEAAEPANDGSSRYEHPIDA